MKNKLLVFATVATFPFFSVAQDLRDPFSRGGNSGMLAEDPISTEVNDLNVTPLTKDPITSYQLAGVIISPTDSIALVRTLSKRDYFANIGDSIGNEGGVIDEMSSEGIIVDINGKLIPLTVSNRFDIQNESN